MSSIQDVRIDEQHARNFYRGLSQRDVDMALSGFGPEATYWGIEFNQGTLSRRLYASRDQIREYLEPWCSGEGDGFTKSDGAEYELVRAAEYGDCLLTEYRDTARKGDRVYENEGIILFEFDEHGFIRHARAYQDMEPILDLLVK